MVCAVNSPDSRALSTDAQNAEGVNKIVIEAPNAAGVNKFQPMGWNNPGIFGVWRQTNAESVRERRQSPFVRFAVF